MTASKRRLLHSVSRLAIGIGALALSPIPASAEEWLGTVSNDWYDPANWTGGVPAGALDVLINRTLPNTTVISGGVIDLSGVSIAISTTDTGELTITGGASLATGQSTITAEPQSIGTVTVTGGGSTWSTDQLVVGFEGQANLRIEDGGIVTSNITTIARNGGAGVVTVDGAGSRWDITDADANFGLLGHAELTIGNGGVVTNSGRIHLGREAAGSGDVVVDGTGSRWEIGENLIIGMYGSASMSVTDGGYVEADIVRLGSSTPGNATSLTLDGQGSELRADGGIQIGITTGPTMSITGGATLTTGRVEANPFVGRSYVGYLQPRGQTASVLISGAGSVWQDANYIVMGNGDSDTTITVENGGALRGRSLDVGRGRGIDPSNPADPFYQEAHLFVSGAGTAVDFDWISVGNAGAKATTDISAGAVVTTGSTLLGGGSTSQGSIVALSDVDFILRGAGTLWTTTEAGEHSFAVDHGESRIRITDQARLDVAGDMELGGYFYTTVSQSTLDMTIDGAGTAHVGGNGLVARAEGSVATVTVDGAGSAWTVDGQLVVGAGGDGTLRVVAGATVTAAGIEIARDAGSAGTLVIGGATTAAAAGVIDTPTIAFGDGDGALVINHTGSLTLSSAISGSGAVSHQAGATELSGDSSGFAGTTTIDGGVLTVSNRLGGAVQVGNGSTVAEFAVVASGNVNDTLITVADNAVATFQNGSSAQIAAIVSSGTVNIHAGADLTGARLAAAAGGVFIVGFDPFGAETHSFGSIEGAGSFRLAGIGGDDLIEVGSDDRSTTISGAISEDFDAVGVRKVGTGTLTLSGINTYTGPTDIDGGVLNVAGSLISAVDVSSGGRLVGVGTIGGLVVNSGGMLAPGNSIGTMTVVGDATFSAGSTYVVELNGGGNLPGINNDLVRAGTATIEGSAIFDVVPENGTDSGTTYAPNTQYTIIETAAPGNLTVNGAPAITDSFAFLNFTGHDDGQNYYLTSSAVAVSFCLPGASFNQCQTGQAVRDLGAGHIAFDTVVGMSEADANAAFDALSGEVHASGQYVIDQTFALFNQTLRGQASAGIGSGMGDGQVFTAPLGYGPTSSNGPGVVAIDDATMSAYTNEVIVQAWLAPLGGRGIVEADGNAGKLDWWTAGIAGGYEGQIDLAGGQAWAGAGLGYLHSNHTVDARLSSSDADGVHIGAYGGWTDGPWSLTGSLAYAANFISTKRNIVFGAINQTANADYWSHTIGFSGEVAYGFDLANGTTLSPLFTLDAAWSGHGGFTETGAGALNLTGAPESWARFDTGLGLALEHVILTETGKLTLDGRLLWEHALADVVSSQGVAFAGSPTGFTVNGPDTGRDRVRLGLGVSFEATEDVTVRSAYTGLFSGSQQSHGASVSLGIKF